MRAAAVVLAALAGCAPAAGPVPTASSAAAIGRCDAGPVQRLVGRKLSRDLATTAQADAAAASLRVVHPQSIVTMDFRNDRLNLYLDESGRVERATCG